MGKTIVSIRAASAGILLCASMLSACGSGAEQASPSVQLHASRTTLVAGEPLRLDWIGANAERCVASGSWSGVFAPASSIDLLPQTPGTLRYTLTCSGPGGSAAASVDVLVQAAPSGPGDPDPEDPEDPEDPAAPAPAVFLNASPLDSLVGTPVTLSWSASNADACNASGGWSGAFAASGSTSVAPPEGSTVYRLQCSGEGGNGSAEVTVIVRPVVPPEPDAALAEFNRVKDLEQGCCNATQ